MEQVKIYNSRNTSVDDNVVLENGSLDNGVTCRLCLKKYEQNSQNWTLFQSDLSQKLMAFAAVQVEENDGLTNVVCTDCRNLVYICYDFKCQVEKCDHDLRQALLLRQPARWSNPPIIKSVEKINSLETMIPCLEKNIINSCIEMQNEHNTNNDDQFIFDIENSCKIENQICKKEDPEPLESSIKVENMINSDSVGSFEINNGMDINEDNSQDTQISFEAHYEIKKEINNKMKIESGDFEENSYQSEDDKPLILRTRRYKCSYCIKSFPNLSLLEKHLVIHRKQPEKVYVCYLCDAEFPSIFKIKNHAIEIHRMHMDIERIMENTKMRRITGWVTKVGDDKQKEDLAKKQVEEKKDSKFLCKFCCRQFAHVKSYESHLKAHPDFSDKLLNELNKGPAMEESHESSVTTTSHPITIEANHSENVEVAHSKNTEISSKSESLESNTQETNTKDASNSQDIISQTVTQEITSSKDINNVEDTSDKGNTEESENDDIDEDEDDNDNDDNDGHNDDDSGNNDDDDGDNEQIEDDDIPIKSVQCTQCGKLVATVRNLKRHMLTHSGLKHNCSICNKDFSRPDKLREHQQMKHKEELFGKIDSENESSNDNNKESTKEKGKKNRPHQCKLCPKAFAQARSLANHEERHNKRVNDVPKRFLCEICSKVFAQSGSLVAHMRTHTGVKPYVCNVCSRAFTKSTYLQLHLRTHSGEKPYTCQYCKRAFARANTLARHITMHTGEAKYKCQICSKSFRRLTSLNEHTYTHTGQRPYACKFCSKRYNNAGSLYAHTKKCKTLQNNVPINTTPSTMLDVTTNASSYPVSLESIDSTLTPQSDNLSDNIANNVPQLLIFTDKKLEEAIAETITDPSACQFMIANVHSQKPMPTNILEPFPIPETDIYNLNSKQFKAPYYGLYPSM